MAERKRAIQLKLWVDENEKNLIEEKIKSSELATLARMLGRC